MMLTGGNGSFKNVAKTADKLPKAAKGKRHNFLGPFSGCDDPAYDKIWNDLSNVTRAAAQSLGYSKLTWENDADVKADNYDWADMPVQMRDALVVLGYTKDTWDGIDDSSAYEQRLRELGYAILECVFTPDQMKQLRISFNEHWAKMLITLITIITVITVSL